MIKYFCKCSEEGVVGYGNNLTEAYQDCMEAGGYSKMLDCEFFKGEAINIEIKEVAVSKIVEKKPTTAKRTTK